MGTISASRGLQEGTEAGLFGTESFTVENVGRPDQIISAGVEEQLALGGFPAERLQAMSLLMDQAGTAQFLGPRYAIDAIAAGPPGVIDTILDLTALLFAGDFVRIEGSDTPGNNGEFEVAAVAAGVPNTVTLETGHTLVADAAPAGGTITKIMSAQVYNLEYEIATTVVPATITYTGNLTDIFHVGDLIRLTGTAAAVNDGIWVILTVDYTAPTTTITLNNLGGVGVLGANGAGVGEFQKFRSKIALAANVPFMWSIESGLNNPLQDVVNFTDFPLQGMVNWAMVNNAGAENAQFRGRVATNAVLP